MAVISSVLGADQIERLKQTTGLQSYYEILRDGEPCVVPIEQLTDAELVAIEEVLRGVADECFREASALKKPAKPKLVLV